MRSNLRRRTITVIALATTLLCGLNAEAKIKCWKNSEGVRECGNSVPPEYAQQGHEVKSKSGLTVERKEQAMTKEALQKETDAILAKQRQERKMKAQAARDRVLLDTFSSEDDMLLARDGQISHLDSQVKIIESHIEKLQNSLEELIQEAADHERRGETPPEKLVEDIASFRQQINENNAFIATKEKDRAAILKKFELDIARFRELKGQPAS